MNFTLQFVSCSSARLFSSSPILVCSEILTLKKVPVITVCSFGKFMFHLVKRAKVCEEFCSNFEGKLDNLRDYDGRWEKKNASNLHV